MCDLASLDTEQGQLMNDFCADLDENGDSSSSGDVSGVRHRLLNNSRSKRLRIAKSARFRPVSAPFEPSKADVDEVVMRYPYSRNRIGHTSGPVCFIRTLIPI